jgi:hypothetical protein
MGPAINALQKHRIHFAAEGRDVRNDFYLPLITKFRRKAFNPRATGFDIGTSSLEGCHDPHPGDMVRAGGIVQYVLRHRRGYDETDDRDVQTQVQKTDQDSHGGLLPL